MSVARYLDCSTAHLTQAEAAGLPGSVEHYTAVGVHDYGWWIWVPPRVDTTSEEERAFAQEHPTLAAVLQLARTQGCRFVCLDADGDMLSELPTFVW